MNLDNMDEAVIRELAAKEPLSAKIISSQRRVIDSLQADSVKLFTLITKYKMVLGKGRVSLIDAKNAIDAAILTTFGDKTGQAYVYTKDKELFPVSSLSFDHWLTLLLDEESGVPMEQLKKQLVPYLTARACRVKRRDLCLTMAQLNNDVWAYPQTKADALLVSSSGEISLSLESFLFKIFDHQEFPGFRLDSGADSLNMVTDFLKLKGDDAKLFIDVLPAFFVPNIQKPIVLCQGDPGSGKSFLGTFLTMLIDPSDSMLDGTAFPKNDSDWFLTATEHLVIFLDNLRQLTADQQDKCCRHITGTFYSTRKLYTDSTLITRRFQGILIINGISLKGLQSDFLERSLPFFLNSIEESERVPRPELLQILRKALPTLRGSCIAILAEARKIYPTIKSFSSSFRLSEFARWAAACVVARGGNLEDFINRLESKVQEQVSETMSQSLIAEPLLKFLEGTNGWKGTSKELLDVVTRHEFEEDGKIKHLPKGWPDTPQEFGRQLRFVRSKFTANGWIIDLPNKTKRIDGQVKREIVIEKREMKQKTLEK